jgi:triosephosphate isomerase
MKKVLMHKKIVVGNWKMNGQISSIKLLLDTISQSIDVNHAKCVVIPPAIYIPFVSSCLIDTCIQWGAQNVYPKNKGAYTGELSALMLREYGCQYVLVGHSERRLLFAESTNFIAEKFHYIKEYGMIPILCIGETQSQYEQGLTVEILTEQLKSVANKTANAFSNCIVAYEPVWAIGSGKNAPPDYVQTVHQSIRALITELGEHDSQTIPLLYGGSVTSDNAKKLFSMPDVDGGLIGSASLNAQQFVEIIKCIN